MNTPTMIDDAQDRAARIRTLNDELRTTGLGGQVYITPGVAAQPILNLVLAAMIDFQAFGSDNAPYQEHDCATFELNGATFIWKIDYYDRGLTAGSPDPADPAVTSRVLTLMLAHEY